MSLCKRISCWDQYVVQGQNGQTTLSKHNSRAQSTNLAKHPFQTAPTPLRASSSWISGVELLCVELEPCQTGPYMHGVLQRGKVHQPGERNKLRGRSYARYCISVRLRSFLMEPLSGTVPGRIVCHIYISYQQPERFPSQSLPKRTGP